MDVHSPIAATVAHLPLAPGDPVEEGQAVAYLELMKMEHPVPAPAAGTVAGLHVAIGEAVDPGQRLCTIDPSASPSADDPAAGAEEEASERGDLAELAARRRLLADQARPEAVARRRARGGRTARENVADLCDEGSFSEYGGFAIAAQRSRRGLEELLERTPADGLVTGFGTVNSGDVELFGEALAGRPGSHEVAVAAYDYTVLAGTQGWANHHKKDRLFALAGRHGIPVVIFAEGGGGRPGDTDMVAGSWLDAEAFHLFAGLSGRVPTIAIVHGRCFAGNAALAGCADVLIATRGSNLGMAGPAMIEGGGLGVVSADDIGPVEVQQANGVIDVAVADEAAAVDVARRCLGYAQGVTPSWEAPDEEVLRTIVPEHRKRPYDMREVLDGLFDVGSVLELRSGWAPGMVTAFGRIAGRPVGVLANNPLHLGGAIDADAGDAAARHLQLCDAWGLPVVVLCDTPGFMVGPEAEREGGVRRFSRMFVAGAALRVPVLAVVTRKGYGLGAQAMLGGHLKAPVLTLAWPTAELGPMGLEGAVRLGFRRELEEIDDAGERAEREGQLVELAHAHARALNVATFAELDDVIDPAETRSRLRRALEGVGAVSSPASGPAEWAPRRRFVDPR